ncbi:hypothetical protein FACS1894140_6710 [Spirochaetia bacterium]|nr:hypothetical protein FACS1894140_6710 [Spirochaetia bacterium]
MAQKLEPAEPQAAEQAVRQTAQGLEAAKQQGAQEWERERATVERPQAAEPVV